MALDGSWLDLLYGPEPGDIWTVRHPDNTQEHVRLRQPADPTPDGNPSLS